MSFAIHVDQQRDPAHLGASEAAGVLGLDKYNPPITIWRRHRGLPVREDDAGEPALWGTYLEPVIRGKYALDRKVRVYVPTGSYTFDGWIRCTPDGLVEDPCTTEVRVDEYDPAEFDPRVNKRSCDPVPGLLQVKTCSAWLEDDWRDAPPAKYEVQCRVEMAVCDLPWNDIVCLCGGQKQLGPFRIERDLALEDRILTSLREFWRMVQDGREPTPDHTDAWRMHVSEKMDRARPVMVAADNHMQLLIARWREQRIFRKRATQSEEQTKNELLLRLSAAGATRIDCGDKSTNVTAYKTKNTWALRTPSSWKEDA